jgi:hypothetical protein
MATKTKIHNMVGDTVGFNAYDSEKITIGTLFKQDPSGWIGPIPLALARPMEQSVAIPAMYPDVYKVNDDLYWILTGDIATAAATRRISLWTYTKSTNAFNWLGFITMDFTSGATGNKTIRGLQLTVSNYTTGTAAVSGTGVTGSGTSWNDARLSVGNRIGFGSTDPNDITTWYQISAIGSNTSITLTSSAGTISDGPYVIQDMMVVCSVTNATAANGGLFVAKGLRPEVFTPTGTTIATGTTTDRLRLCYWLADAGTVTNTTAMGCSLEPMIDWQTHYCYVGNVGVQIYKYNIRASLASLSAGKSTSALTLITGTQAVTGTASQTNSHCIATLSHGPGAGIPSLYFATTTRVYRAALSSITNGNTSWQSDVMVEVPPGGITTYPATSALANVEYDDVIDRLIVMSTGTAGARSYITKYNTSSDPFDHIFLVDTKQSDQSTSAIGGVIHPSIAAVTIGTVSVDGILFLVKQGTASINSAMYSMPLAAHWAYAQGTNQFIVTRKIMTSDATKYRRVYAAGPQQLGTGTMGLPPEPYRMYWRTNGIDDNSGSWTLVPDNGDLSNVSVDDAIQFAFEFKILGLACVPSYIYSLALVYEDSRSIEAYSPSLQFTSASNLIFAWRQTEEVDGYSPILNISITNIDTNNIVLDDDTDASSSGIWEYSTNNGVDWAEWDINAFDIGNYIRYTANSLPASIRAKARISYA